MTGMNHGVMGDNEAIWPSDQLGDDATSRWRREVQEKSTTASGPSDIAISIELVRKVYGGSASGAIALKEVSLDINDNEFFTLLGPSGCGKTTLLRLIAGFEFPTAGELRLFGQEIEHLPPYKRPINTVFQQYALFPHMTLAENIRFGLENLRMERHKADARVEEMLRLVKMERFADRRPNQLSGGQQQRIALARALAPAPKVLLLDEPLSALDLKLRQSMRLELKSIQKKTGITFVFVTHDQEEALAMSDRIAVMSEGQVQQVGSPSEIYEHPSNRFVADFIGESNFIEATVLSVADGLARCRSEAGHTIICRELQDTQPGQQRTLAVRPEKVRLVSRDKDEALPGIIRDVVYLGTDVQYWVGLSAGGGVSARVQNNPDSDMSDLSPGASVGVRFDTDAVRMLGQ